MFHSTTLFKRDHHLLYTNFTKSNTMEDKKVGLQSTHGAKSLADLKKELQELNTRDSLSLTGGRTVEKDRWNTHCGGIVPQ